MAAYVRAALQQKVVGAVHAPDPADGPTATELLRGFARPAGGPGRAGQDSGPTRRLAEPIRAMMADILWETGSDAESRLPPDLADYDARAAELTSAELMRVAAGEQLPNAEEVKNLRLREERGGPPRSSRRTGSECPEAGV